MFTYEVMMDTIRKLGLAPTALGALGKLIWLPRLWDQGHLSPCSHWTSRFTTKHKKKIGVTYIPEKSIKNQLHKCLFSYHQIWRGDLWSCLNMCDAPSFYSSMYYDIPYHHFAYYVVTTRFANVIHHHYHHLFLCHHHEVRQCPPDPKQSPWSAGSFCDSLLCHLMPLVAKCKVAPQ